MQSTASPMEETGDPARIFLAGRYHRLTSPLASKMISAKAFLPPVLCVEDDGEKMASSESVQHVGRGGLSFDFRRCQHKTYNEISQRRLSRAVVESRCLGGNIYF